LKNDGGSKMPQNKIQAFIWTREFTQERLQVIRRLERKWKVLFHEPGHSGHYVPYQWLGVEDSEIHYYGEHFSIIIDGEECRVHLKIITAKEWFAKKVYEQALAKTRDRYPNFDSHHFVDGLRTGERILEFLSEEWDLAKKYFWTALWATIEDEAPAVNETIIIEPCCSWGYPAAVAATKSFDKEIAPRHKLITVIRNVDKATKEDCEVIAEQLKNGSPVILNETPVTFSFQDIRDGFTELSSPELAVLNWMDAKPTFSDVDNELYAAVCKLNKVWIEQAIAKGANVNAFHDYNTSMISALLESWRDHREHCHAHDDELDWHGGPRPEREILEPEIIEIIEYLLEHGMSPDLHGPEGSTGIIDAALGCYVGITELLLKRGANAAIEYTWDCSRGEWAQTWETASYDAYDDNDARAIYNLLLINRPSPIYDKEQAEVAKAMALGIKQPTVINHTCENEIEEESLELLILPGSYGIYEWITNSKNPIVEEVCVRFAMAFNTLDIKWLNNSLLSTDVKYASQHVFSEIQGRRNVIKHLANKIENLSNNPNDHYFELAITQDEKPCVAGFQKQSEDDSEWMMKPITNIIFSNYPNEPINDIFIVTIVPRPDSVKLTGIRPGLDSNGIFKSKE
jgi:hypothetical protein